MIELELDGKTVNAEPGSTILEVALREGKYVPHFCYHKKLSIAANCRMCLVEVEKAPKPLPACATPIAEGMKVHTCSQVAVEAQKGVMEFLLINHPLDCPICDQGGECQLQDLAVGYGKSSSRFDFEKRAVSNKDLGPLVATEMTRCIHCSRCVRFTDEIAGFQELGMSYRNNHVEVMPFLGKTVDSELSGNVIDLCPVGALTSKPFRNQYRSWELARRKSIAPHDSLGSNIIAQVDKYHKVVRILPHENEDLNECWLSDRDRFSYEGLYHEDRTTTPMIKQDGKWVNVDFATAINYVANTLNDIKTNSGADSIGVLASDTSTTEELYLLQKAMRAFGVNNIDSRLSQKDFSLDNQQAGTTYLGANISELTQSKSVLVIGSLLREEHPLIAHRLRDSIKRGTELNVINIIHEDLLCNTANKVTCDPRELEYTIAQVVKASEELLGITPSSDDDIDLTNVTVSPEAKKIAKSINVDNPYIIFGEIAKTQPNYSSIYLLIQRLAKNINGKFGQLVLKANSVGAELVGFVPHKKEFNQKIDNNGLNVYEMLANPRNAYVLLNTELEHDVYDSALALQALSSAKSVIVMSAFVNEKMKQYADVILPITPYTETAGSFVNMEGKWQQFNGVTRPFEGAKPGWKVIRVIANALNIDGFDYNTIIDVRNELQQLNEPNSLLNNTVTTKSIKNITVEKPQLNGLVRLGIQGIYNIDSITRRAISLQQSYYGQLPTLTVNSKLATKLNINENATVSVKQGDNQDKLNTSFSDDIPETVVLLAVNNTTVNYSGRYDQIEIQ